MLERGGEERDGFALTIGCGVEARESGPRQYERGIELERSQQLAYAGRVVLRGEGRYAA